MRVVLDTNVIYSALLNPRGRPAQVLRLALHGAEAIVTGNARHFPEAEIGVVVLTPRQLIDLLGD